MKKIILTEKSLYEDILPDQCKIDNNELDRRIIEQHKEFNYSFINKYEDLDLIFIKEIKWISDYIQEKMLVYHGQDIYLIDYFANIQKPGHISFKRNNENLNDIRNSCDYTALYVVNGDGNLYLEYDNNIKKKQTYFKKLKQKTIVLFNSSIDYYIDRNKTEYNRIIINFLFKKQK